LHNVFKEKKVRFIRLYNVLGVNDTYKTFYLFNESSLKLNILPKYKGIGREIRGIYFSVNGTSPV